MCYPQSIAKFLTAAPALQQEWEDHHWEHANWVLKQVSKFLTPFVRLPANCVIKKGPICLKDRDGYRVWPLELAFSVVADAVIALRQKG